MIGVLLAALVSYAMMVTFSRGGWAGLLVGLAVVILGLLLARRGRRPGTGTWIAAGVLVAAVGAVSVPVLTGAFATERLAGSVKDLQTRLAHWERALSLMGPGSGSVLVGEGFGQYPLAYLLLAQTGRPPGTFAIIGGW